ncbi:hypothetical protein BGW36DRAFT_203031 [Talaromyces proteolyticus]|uniref:UBC core domain-containing protein n=1 Tax=Talaromyces proteolyticus TaxID=1131652 RepID=A0AAD4KMS5_9EURO|nr:uncharacterized protein BGW36DRAFT_203031 [Talaromyces proteolyticus]KAH8695490.1 hypothetical protein BGW36DRAFT_203031 [Talaromyces proteolyticus]
MEIAEFLQTGVPPKGYVYVMWIDHSDGHSLVSEDELDLVDRPIDIGNFVKRSQTDTMIGRVIGIFAKYTLRPIAYREVDPRLGERGPVKFTKKKPKWYHPHEIDTSNPPLLEDVDEEDLTSYDDYYAGKYIIYRQKVGIVQWTSRDVVLMLPNQSVVIPQDPRVVDTPLEADPDIIISQPPRFSRDPFDEGRYMPDFLRVPGDWVHTPLMNLKRGDWIHGSYSDNHSSGNILFTATNEVSVEWVCSNVFAIGAPSVGQTSEVLRVSDIRNEAKVYDFLKTPGVRGSGGYQLHGARFIGDIVRFKDPAGAAVKYSRFDRIPASETFSYDVNAFTIVSSKTDVVVQWQDLSTTTQASTSLHRLSAHEDVIMPGEIVALKDTIQTIPNHSTRRFDPSTYSTNFGGTNASILQLNQVGVVQNVNSREQVASIRWFKDPHVDLLYQGKVLRPTSVLGEPGDESNEVSMYELATYDALRFNIQEQVIVIIVPGMVHSYSLVNTPEDPSSATAGQCALSHLWPVAFTYMNVYLEDIKKVIVNTEWFRRSVKVDYDALLGGTLENQMAPFDTHQPLDWVGHIVEINLDGTVTVRLGALDQCRDIRLPLERVLMVVDEDSAGQDDETADLMHALVDQFGDGDDRLEFLTGLGLSQWIRGHPENEDWTTESDEEESDEEESDEEESDEEESDEEESDEEESDEEEYVEESFSHGYQMVDNDNDVIMEDAPPGVVPPSSEHAIERSTTEGTSILDPARVNSDPPKFAILDTPPPFDHHFSHTKVVENGNALALRRITKEYKILETSLPPGIFARTWESRMDLLRVLIIGPEGTPYEYAPHVVDFHFDKNFPNQPPNAFFHSWTNSMGRINPNLYEDGKICLSILGTWSGKNADEMWSPSKSTLLQILVSIMGLVLVKDPFYSISSLNIQLFPLPCTDTHLDEAGFEVFAAEGNQRVESSQYTEKSFVMTRAFIKRALERSVPDFEDILAWQYLPGSQSEKRPCLLQKAISEARKMIEHYNSASDKKDEDSIVPASPFVSRLSLGAVVMLRKHLDALEKLQNDAEERVGQL